jgi:two-component system cell cycle sensor histidine kinase/response regulator CckA
MHQPSQASSPFPADTRVLETISDAVFVLDRDWRVSYANGPGLRLMRRPRDEVTGRVIWEIFPEAVDTRLYREYHRAVREGVAVEFEEHFAASSLWLYVRAFPSADGLTVTIQDITARKQAEAARARLVSILEETTDLVSTAAPDGREVPTSQVIIAHRSPAGEVEQLSTIIRDLGSSKRAEEALRASEAEMLALVEAVSDVILVIDRAGTYCKVAPSAPDRLARPADELMGRRLHEIFPREQADEFLALVQRALDTGERVDAEYSLEIEGRRYHFATTVCPMAGGERVVWLARDVTERHLQEEALRASEERLRQSQKMEAVGRLAGGIAHDFNNLLTVIRGNAEMLLMDLPPESPLRADAEEVRRAADRAAALTRQLLAFSRREVVRPRVLSLNRLVGDLQRMLRRVIGEDVALETELGAGRDLVLADPGQVEQLVVNLAVNARDAVAEGGSIRVSTAEVEVGHGNGGEPATRGVPAGSYVALTVSDTGSGMDEAVLERIFEPFFTTKEQGKGTGLGLATVYGIVRQSGGHVTVESAPGEGSTFRVFLPHADAPAEDAGDAAAAAGPARGSGTVLLVEDATGVRTFAARVLARCGYHVLEARDGREALDVAQAFAGRIDLLLTDVVMPEVGGPELARRLHPLRPDAGVVYMTGYADGEVLRTGLFPPGAPLLPKPFSAEALADAVEEALRTR